MSVPITRLTWIARLAVLLGIGFVAFALWLGSETVLFSVDGARATGTVVSKRIDPTYFSSNAGSASQFDDPNGYFVTFTFTPPSGSAVQSEVFIDHDDWTALAVGGPLQVDYVQLFPASMNWVDGTGGGSGPGVFFVVLFGLAGVACIGFSTRFLVCDRRRRALVQRLTAVGVRTTGTVLDNNAAQLWVRYNLQRRIRYGYADSAGHQHAALSDWMPRASAVALHAKSTGVVRYDPDQPGQSAWFDREDSA